MKTGRNNEARDWSPPLYQTAHLYSPVFCLQLERKVLQLENTGQKDIASSLLRMMGIVNMVE